MSGAGQAGTGAAQAGTGAGQAGTGAGHPYTGTNMIMMTNHDPNILHLLADGMGVARPDGDDSRDDQA